MSCPRCNSSLYERTPAGWRCSSCNYRERLEDLDVLVQKPPRGIHGNVWGQVKETQNTIDNGPFRVIRIGSLDKCLELYKQDKTAALAYLGSHEFAGKANLNRHYLAAKICFELHRFKDAKKHIDVCRAKLKNAKDDKGSRAILALFKEINFAIRDGGK